MPIQDKEELKEFRKQTFSKMEQQLKNINKREEDGLFYYHSSENRIVLSHALFWVMTLPQNFKSSIRKEKSFLVLRNYQEEMLDDFLQEDDQFSDLLHYCNIQYEIMLYILNSVHDVRKEKDALKLAAIAVVAVGYGGDMSEDLCNELLDDIDYENNKVKCRKIEQMLPKLNKMVEEEMKAINNKI